MNGKKIVWVVIGAIAALALFHKYIYKVHINPDKETEAMAMEDGKYIYMVQEYGKFPKEGHIIRKINGDTGKTMWKKKMDTNHHLNHQNHKELPALFSDDTALYYYIHDMDEHYYLLKYDKFTGENEFNIRLRDHIPGDRVDAALYVPYLELRDRILFFSTYFFREEDPVYTMTVTSVKKDGSEVINTKLETDEHFVAYPQGAEDINEKYITMYDMPETLILLKEDMSKQQLVKDNYNPGLLRDGHYCYLSRQGGMVERDLETVKSKVLFSRADLKHSFFMMYDHDGFVVHKDDKKREYFTRFSFDGKREWTYKIPEGWYFGDLFAWEHTHASPSESIYYYLKHDFLPVVLTKRTRDEDEMEEKAVVMLNIKTGAELWKEELTDTDVHDLNSSTLFYEDGYYYILWKGKLIQADGESGKIIKSFRLYLDDNGEEYDLISSHYLKMHSFSGNKALIHSYGDYFAVIDLVKGSVRHFGNVRKGIEIKFEVDEKPPFFE